MENKKLKSDLDIEFRDLLWEMLRSWRTILSCMLIFAVGLTIYQYRSDLAEAATTPQISVQKTIEELQDGMGEQDRDDVSGAVAVKAQLDQKGNYLDHSLLMQVNPYAEQVVFLQYTIDAGADSAQVAELLRSYVADGCLGAELVEQENLATELMYVNELIQVADATDLTYINAKNANETIVTSVTNGSEAAGSKTLVIKVIVVSVDDAVNLPEQVEAVWNAQVNTLSAEYDQCQVKLVNRINTSIVDEELAEYQNRTSLAIKTMASSLDNMKSEMTGDQLALYRAITDPIEEDAVVDEATGEIYPKQEAVTISFKMLLIGLLVGMVLGILIALCRYLLTGKLRNAEEVKKLYDIKILGRVDDGAYGKKRLCAAVDRFIHNLEHHNTKALTYEEQMQMAVTNIWVSCNQLRSTEVYLTGTDMEQMSEQFVEELAQACAKKGILVKHGVSLTYDAASLEEAVRTKAVILVERMNHSYYEDMYQLVNLCGEAEIAVVGMVVLER